ncbi:DNA-binding response regulator [Chromobacterium sphagni]|uniref:DNA-binding response regulator n=1 Tax=Chromobacterium sphagni TaxID=1903179 RepID=A0A1S1WUW9_9NEIS|nr:response regulator transcription factor [Chromobacterium sphagni]OHX10890.1 DNA-binding response regulator [Chromobacterium sphagni]
MSNSKSVTGQSLHPIRIALLDDHLMILHGLASHLAGVPDLQITGSFTASSQLIQALANEQGDRADVVVIDYTLRPDDIDGINLIRALRIRFPPLRLLVMSAYYTPATVALALRGGAHGFIGKEQGLDELVAAIRALAAGRDYLSAEMSQALQARQDKPEPPPHGPSPTLLDHPDLSPREREVLRCCLHGLSVSDIAAKFSRSIKTISNQKQSALKKLGLRRDNELFQLQHRLEDK